jgi:DNA-binding transcriptional LysR family regulator
MQSAVTGFTKALETELGRKLFDRYSNSQASNLQPDRYERGKKP